MDYAVSKGELTISGKAAFIVATDPFHDTAIADWRGWPDLETAKSVTRCVRQSFTVKSSGDGDNLMLYTWPILNESVTHRASRRNSIIDLVTPGVSTDFNLGPLTVMHYADTSTMTLTNGTYAWHSFLDPDYLLDDCRLCGMGVEVYDVTAELYKQGTCTVFCVPQSTTEPEPFWVKDVVFPSPMSSKGQQPFAPHPLGTPVQGIPLKKFPTSMAQIMELAGTRQWEAKDGAYAVIPFHGRDNFPGQPTYETPLLYVDTLDAHERVEFLNTTPFNIGGWATPLIENDNVVFLANKFSPVHSKGILLSGLNEKSTFTINVVYYLESFPAPDNRQLITLAEPSAPLDELALELVSAATQSLPVAVPVCENGLGDWFAEVVAEVAPWIAAAGAGLGVPLVSAAATAAEAAAQAYMKSPSYTPTTPTAKPRPNAAKPLKPKVQQAKVQRVPKVIAPQVAKGQKQRNRKNKKKKGTQQAVLAELDQLLNELRS